MKKQEQFLWGLQTLILLDAQNFSLETENAIKNRHEISATGRFGDVMGAIEASSQIPDDVTVQDAIHEYYYWRYARYSNESERPARPSWLRRQEW